jgi:hypothetical protein
MHNSIILFIEYYLNLKLSFFFLSISEKKKKKDLKVIDKADTQRCDNGTKLMTKTGQKSQEWSCTIFVYVMHFNNKIMHNSIILFIKYYLNLKLSFFFLSFFIYFIFKYISVCNVKIFCTLTIIYLFKLTWLFWPVLTLSVFSEKKFIYIYYLMLNYAAKHWLIDWCLMPTLAVFQLYCGMLTIYM